MDWADDLTYAIHDMEDFFRAGLVPLDRLCTSERERDRFYLSFLDEHTGDPNKRLEDFEPSALRTAVEDIFGDRLDFVDPYSGTRAQRQILRERTSFLVRHYMHALDCSHGELSVDPLPRTEIAILKELTWFYVINRQELATVQEGQRRVIEGLCERYWAATESGSFHLFPPFEQEALAESKTTAETARTVCDFVARLTEARALELHQRLLGASVPLIGPPAH